MPAETIRRVIYHAAAGVGLRATVRLLELDKDTVNRVILRAGEQCGRVFSGLLTSLHLTEAQRYELWIFVKTGVACHQLTFSEQLAYPTNVNHLVTSPIVMFQK